MIELFKKRSALKKARKNRARLRTQFWEEELAARQKKLSDEARHDMYASHAAEWFLVQEEVCDYRTDLLRVEAEVYDLSLPPIEDDSPHWEKGSHVTNGYILTEVGAELVRGKINAAKQHRREAAAFWINGITTVLSLIVAIIAMIWGMIAGSQ